MARAKKRPPRPSVKDQKLWAARIRKLPPWAMEPIDTGIDPWTVLPSDLLPPEDDAAFWQGQPHGNKKRLNSHHQKLAAARIEKLSLLAKHYSIDAGPGYFLMLAYRLATDFVPGFWDAASPDTPRSGQRGPKALDADLLWGAFEGLKGHKLIDGREHSGLTVAGYRVVAGMLKQTKLGDGVASTDREAAALIRDWQLLWERVNKAPTGASDKIINAWVKTRKLDREASDPKQIRALVNRYLLARRDHEL